MNLIQDWDQAYQLIDITRDMLDTELTALSAESYQRAYPIMVQLQMLAELEEAIEYNHIRTPLYTIRLSSAYEDNITGVHGMNKAQQKWAMDEFVAGRMSPGEMGNGIVLEDVEFKESLKMTARADTIIHDRHLWVRAVEQNFSS